MEEKKGGGGGEENDGEESEKGRRKSQYNANNIRMCYSVNFNLFLYAIDQIYVLSL